MLRLVLFSGIAVLQYLVSGVPEGLPFFALAQRLISGHGHFAARLAAQARSFYPQLAVSQPHQAGLVSVPTHLARDFSRCLPPGHLRRT